MAKGDVSTYSEDGVWKSKIAAARAPHTSGEPRPNRPPPTGRWRRTARQNTPARSWTEGSGRGTPSATTQDRPKTEFHGSMVRPEGSTSRSADARADPRRSDACPVSEVYVSSFGSGFFASLAFGRRGSRCVSCPSDNCCRRCRLPNLSQRRPLGRPRRVSGGGPVAAPGGLGIGGVPFRQRQAFAASPSSMTRTIR